MSRVNRRTFLGTMGSIAAARLAHGQATPVRFGVIGCGWYGLVGARAAFKAGGVSVEAVCDVDSAHLEKAVAEIEGLQGRRPRAFKHHRELLAMAELDAVLIATPPHWHALQFIDACRRGVDIYCEKPLSYDISEGQAMVAAAQQAGRVVQIGFQRRQSAAVKAAAQFIREGRAGRIVEVEARIHYDARKNLPDPTPAAPPATLDWDLWCGPAPLLPYSKNIGHFSWRLEKAYGHGHLVDWGIHWIDSIRATLGEAAPRAVTAAGGLVGLSGRITTPDVLAATFDFATCPVVWRHRIWGATELSPAESNGITYFGDKATVWVNDGGWSVKEEGRDAVVQPTEPSGDAAVLHMKEFLDAVRAKRTAGCLPEDAWRSTTAVQLAMIAYETGSRVEWDAAKGVVVGAPAAVSLGKRAYRTPYVHPGRA